MKVVFLASLLVAMLATYPSVCHGLPTPEAKPYRYDTGGDNRQSAKGREEVESSAKPYEREPSYRKQDEMRRPPYPQTYYKSYQSNPSYRKEEDFLAILLKQVPKQTPYNPIPYAIYFQMTADDVPGDDNGISY